MLQWMNWDISIQLTSNIHMWSIDNLLTLNFKNEKWIRLMTARMSDRSQMSKDLSVTDLRKTRRALPKRWETKMETFGSSSALRKITNLFLLRWKNSIPSWEKIQSTSIRCYLTDDGCRLRSIDFWYKNHDSERGKYIYVHTMAF